MEYFAHWPRQSLKFCGYEGIIGRRPGPRGVDIASNLRNIMSETAVPAVVQGYLRHIALLVLRDRQSVY